jgi:5-methyltetrahydropteroyltriglutamate--homocysteine methyltransferase
VAQITGVEPKFQKARFDPTYAVDLPQDKIIMPGVIDSTTNFIEHLEVVTQRIVRYAKRVGRENVIPGSACGFGTGAGLGAVDTDIVWAKLAALAQGAQLASDRVSGR